MLKYKEQRFQVKIGKIN